jgi:hypothetical protein
VRRLLCALGLALLLTAPPLAGTASGSPRSYRIPFCIDKMALIPKHAVKLAIPVGCALVDCCPGCPAAGSLAWRVRLGGRALRSVTLGFEGLSLTGSLEVEGDGRPTPDGVRIGRGGAVVRNLRGAGETVPVATLELDLDPLVVAQLQEAELAAAPGATVDTVEVAIDQLLGPVPVNEFRLQYPLRPCRPRPGGSCVDRVTQQDNRLGDDSVLLLDGRRTGVCGDDEQYRGKATAPVGDLRAAAGCRSELAVFSEGDAMQMHDPETAWTDACGDVALASLEPPLLAPVKVWLAWPTETFGAAASALATALAASHFANANLVYDRNKTGIQFEAQVEDISAKPRAKLAVALGCLGASQFPTQYYAADRLNVYYSPLPYTGENCEQNHNMIFVGTLANLATLAHEFGHALSLFGEKETGGHTNDRPEFTDQNLMWGGGPATRDHVALGQAFRFNLDPASFLNVHGVRTGPERDCPALVTSDACPKLHLDWSRP